MAWPMAQSLWWWHISYHLAGESKEKHPSANDLCLCKESHKQFLPLATNWNTPSKGQFSSRMITIKITIRTTIFVSSPMHNNFLYITSANCRFVLCHLKCSSSLKQVDSDWLSMFLAFISWKNCSESHSNDIVPLCRYHYTGASQ